MSITRNRINKHFSVLPNAITCDVEVSSGAFRMFAYLSTKPDNWQVYNKDIMKQLNIGNDRTIAKYWKELIESGWVTRAIKKDKEGKCIGGYDYELMEKKTTMAVIANGNNCECGITAIHSNTKLNNKKEEKKEIYKESFEEVWKMFPKQRIGNKDYGYKAYVKAINEDRTNESSIKESIEFYSKSEEVLNGYAKGFAAWMNDDRFNNDYSIKSSNNQQSNSNQQSTPIPYKLNSTHKNIHSKLKSYLGRTPIEPQATKNIVELYAYLNSYKNHPNFRPDEVDYTPSTLEIMEEYLESKQSMPANMRHESIMAVGGLFSEWLRINRGTYYTGDHIYKLLSMNNAKVEIEDDDDVPFD